jgi:Amt family ammonium transporter
MMSRLLRYAVPMLLLAPSAFAQDAAPTIDTGNTTWLLVCCALVMLMTPGLAFFYAGMVHHKNVVSTLLQNFVALAIVGLLWVVVGYSLAFSPGNGYIGGLDFVLLDGVMNSVNAGGYPDMAFMAFQMMFAIITPALITGAVAERVNFSAWMLLMGLWSLIVYVPVANWVWNSTGWLFKDGALDFAGGLVVHITSGCAGLVAALMLGKRLKGTEPTLPNDVPMIMLGAALLWFGWFGFNAGSALAAGTLAAHAFVTTFVGGAAAFLSWMVIDWFRTGRPSAVGAATGIVVGLVTITPAAGFVSVGHAILMCAVSGVICNIIAHYIKNKTHLDDALDVFACHGLGGILGSIMTGLFASSAVNPAVATQGLLIDGSTTLFLVNLKATAIVVAYACVVTFVLIKGVNLFIKLRVAEDKENHGLDKSLHGEHKDAISALSSRVAA